MEIKKITWENVSKDGTFTDGSSGAIETDGAVRAGSDNNGDEYLTICLPRDSRGCVEVIQVIFDSEHEKNILIKQLHGY